MFLRSLKQHSSSYSKFNLHILPPFNSIARQLFDEFTKPKEQRDQTNLQSLTPSVTPAITELVLKQLKQWKYAHELFNWVQGQPGYEHNCYTYNTMASILTKGKRKSQLRALANDMVTRGCVMTPGALGFFIRCLGSLNLVEEAKFVFENSSKLSCIPNIYTYNCFLEVLGKLGQIDLMQNIIQEIELRPDLKPDKYTYTSMLKCYYNAGKFENMYDILPKMSSNCWVDTHVLTIFIVSFCKLGKVDNALELFDKMKRLGLIGDFTLYSALIDGLCDNKEINKVLNILDEMKMNSMLPNTRLVQKIVYNFCEKGDFSNACKVFVEITKGLKQESIVPICNTLLEGFVNKGAINKANNLLKLMTGFDQELNEIINLGFDQELLDIIQVIKPNDDSFDIVICGLCKINKLDEALNLLNNMIQLGYKGRIKMYNDLINELCKVDRLEESYKLFHKMKEFNFIPTEFTYNCLLYGNCRANNSRESLNLIKEMRVFKYTPWIKNCTKMVQNLCLNQKLEEASNFLNEIIEIGFLPDLIPLSAFINGLSKLGFIEKTEKIFRKNLEKNYLPDVVAYNILINGFVRNGNFEKAEGFFDEMLQKGLNPSIVTYNLMIDGFCKNNNIKKAFYMLNKMVTEEKNPNIVTYTSLIDGLLNESRFNEALDLFIEMREKGLLINEISYIALVNGLCKCGKAKVALSFYHEMREKGFEIDLFGRFLLINCLILERESIEAFEILNEFFVKMRSFSANCRTMELMHRAVYSLYKDDNTSLGIKELIEKGLIPFISSVDQIDNLS